VTVEHGRIRFQAGGVHFSSQLEPAIGVALVGTNIVVRKISAPPPGRINPASIALNHVFVLHLVEMSEVIQLDHSERLQVELRILTLKRRQQVGEIAKG
jgi:hypothetical protein